MPTANRVLESALETFFLAQVRSIGGLTVKLAPTVAGLPDRLVLLPGGVLGLVELKTSTGRLSPAQEVWHERARKLGINVHVLRGKGEILAWIRSCIQDPRPGKPGPKGTSSCPTCSSTTASSSRPSSRSSRLTS